MVQGKVGDTLLEVAKEYDIDLEGEQKSNVTVSTAPPSLYVVPCPMTGCHYVLLPITLDGY